MTTAGIPFAALDFYDDLEADNSKSFWTEHRELYETAVLAPLKQLAEALTPEFGPAKFFRPYRDVRFSKDKTPYKTQQGVWFGESHRYLHVSAAGVMVGAGMYRLERDQLVRYRRAVGTDLTGDALAAAVDAVRRSGAEITGDRLTRLPSGFDADHPHAELARFKTLTARRDFGSPDWLPTARTQKEVLKSWRAMQPLVDWLTTHVGPTEELPARRR